MFVAQDLDVQVDQLQVRLGSRVVVTSIVGKVSLSEKDYLAWVYTVG